ncbi:MAG TPA: arginine--tRNA ligase, partial [Kocuria sp.]|nr:arginine--tRNA ligase [Kocuria sp.]
MRGRAGGDRSTSSTGVPRRTGEHRDDRAREAARPRRPPSRAPRPEQGPAVDRPRRAGDHRLHRVRALPPGPGRR